jgi:S-adenosylmethionine-dependent methyltransferase
VPDESPFAALVDRWTLVLGRLRDVVRQRVLAAQLAEVIASSSSGGPLRILDVGCGQGTQALVLAEAGHVVTGLDTSEQLLERFREMLSAASPEVRDRVELVLGRAEMASVLTPGPFDLVLCHGVLMYYDDATAIAQAIDAVAGPAARVSLLVRNGLSAAMRPALLGRWAESIDAFDTTHYVNRLGVTARFHTLDETDALLGPLGWTRECWRGVRVFTDHLDMEAPPSAELDVLIEAERTAGERDPYRTVAALLHVVYRRGSA